MVPNILHRFNDLKPAAPADDALDRLDVDWNAECDDGEAALDGIDELRAIVADVAAAVGAPAVGATDPGPPRTFVSFGILERPDVHTVEVAFDAVVDLINHVGEAAAAAGLVDVQFSLTKRASKRGADLQAVYGVMVDVDQRVADMLTEIEKAGVPMPTFVFESLNGWKAAWVSTSPIAPSAFDEIAKKLTLAFDGGDASSWSPSQMQRTPTCLKRVAGAIVPVTFKATQANGTPFAPTPEAAPFPLRVRRALGAGDVGAVGRKLIRDYLEDRGIPASDELGDSLLYDACPASDAHSSKCCYVNVTDDGTIVVCCLAGHEGEGRKVWHEPDLLALAAPEAEHEPGVRGFDPLRHLPVTGAAVQFITFKLQGWPGPLVDASMRLWRLEHARRDARGLVDVREVQAVYDQRLGGVDGIPAMEAYFDRASGRLVHDLPDGRAAPVTGKQGPSLKTNATELKSTGLWHLHIEERDGLVRSAAAWHPDAESYVHKLGLGHGDVLASFGVAGITTYALPVAHVTEQWSIDPTTHHIEAVTLRETFESVDEVDAVEFFLRLHRAGRLPLASENDVLLFVMLLTLPLLRHIAPGQLGIVWLVGPSGAGKDFLAELARRVWEACGTQHARVSFDVNLAGDLELKRSLEMAAGCIYARAKEAGKRGGMTEMLIRLAGTDSIAVRGLFKDEAQIPNSFTYVAESAEDLPDRREISRRTVLISVTPMEDRISKGDVVEEVSAAAKGLLKDLKRLVETKPREWYLRQSDTGSRPLVPVALSRLLGATLPAVQGEDLTEVFEAMAAYTTGPDGEQHGADQRTKICARRADKTALEERTFPSYSFAHFIDVMALKPGNAELFSPYARKSKELITRIVRETEYRIAVSAQGYMAIEIGPRRFAFRIFDRRFILVPELEFNTKLTEARAGASVGEPARPSRITPPARAAGATGPTVRDTTRPTFTADDDALIGKVGS